MNKLFSKIAALSVGLAMAVGVGVAVSSEAKVENAKADGDIEITFPGSPSQKTSAYTKTFTMTVSDVTFSFANWNNGSSSDSWDAIRGGQKKNDWEGTITSGAISSYIEKVVVNVTQVSNSTGSKLEVASDSEFTTDLQTIDKGAITATGNIEFEVPTQVTGSYYRLTFDQTKGSANGELRLGGITYVVGTGPTTGYSVTYNKNDSSAREAKNMPSKVTGLSDGDVVPLTGSPTRWGYTFIGWGDSASSVTPITSVTIDDADETVYAIWQEDHTVAGAWSDSPYSVAQARTAIDNNEHLNDVYVAGIISQVDSYNSTYKSIYYWISDDGTTTNQFEVYSGKGLNGADFSAVTDVEVGAQVVVNGNIKKYNSTYEFDVSSQQISYVGPSTGDIEVTFQTLAFAGVGDEGTYSASTDAENPSYSFSSDNSSVLSVASNGDWEAKAAGSATVRVDVTSDDGNGHKEVAVTVVEVKSVSEAYEIAEGLSSGQTTDYSIKVSGFVSSLDADGKARAINLTDGEGEIEAFFGGGNADYNTAISELIGGKVSLYGKVQNYSGTYELKDITLESVAQGDANSYGAGAYKSLDGSCETGVDAVTEAQWTAVSNGFNHLDASEQAEFRKDVVSGNVEKWVGRYTRIVSNTSLNDFMSLGIASSRIQPFAATEDSNLMLIVVITTIASVSAIAILLVIKRRKSSRK